MVYAALGASLATPLYDPVHEADAEWWALPSVLVFAHLGLGAAVGRLWVLAVPVVFSFVFFLLGGGDALASLWLIVGAPLLFSFTEIGMAFRMPIPLFALAALPALWAGAETQRRGEHMPASLQRQLPTRVSLGSLCPDASSRRSSSTTSRSAGLAARPAFSVAFAPRCS